MCPKALLLESWGGRGVAENLKNGGGGGCRSLFKKRWEGAAGTRTSKRHMRFLRGPSGCG